MCSDRFEDIRKSNGIDFDTWWSKLRSLLLDFRDTIENGYHKNNISLIQNDYKDVYQEDFTPKRAFTIEVGRLNVEAMIDQIAIGR
ncbi:MAG: hypothetical protein AMJ53_11290 [Gammaproteobacteria bacterium SG8_11]|nr:MAG: hypothetical protein AMJ53_11290 [Gammaproteobacteria bacterium SG8_11]